MAGKQNINNLQTQRIVTKLLVPFAAARHMAMIALRRVHIPTINLCRQKYGIGGFNYKQNESNNENSPIYY